MSEIRIEEYFNENPKASLKDGVRALKFSKINSQMDCEETVWSKEKNF